MITLLLVVLAVSLVGLFLVLGKKAGVKALSKGVGELSSGVKAIMKGDPIEHLGQQIKAYKLKLSELQGNTESLKSALDKEKGNVTRCTLIMNKAKAAGNRSHALEAFKMQKNAIQNQEAIEEDIKANTELYESMVDTLSKRQTELNQFESKKKRNEMRSSCNEIRRDIAKDQLLEEGLYGADLSDDCQEEIEAIALEKVHADTSGKSLFEEYETDDTDEEFDKFFTDKE